MLLTDRCAKARKAANVEHIAIDLEAVNVKSAGGTRRATSWRSGAAARVSWRRISRHRQPAVVIVETCTEAFRVADIARRHGHNPRMVSGTLVQSLGIGQRGLKNDGRDARALSEASCRMALPSVHLSSSSSREWRALCRSREALLRTRTQLISGVRSYVRARSARNPASTSRARRR
jgi:transposase